MTEWQAARIIELLEGITAMLEKQAYPESWLIQDPETGETHVEKVSR